MAVKRIIQTFFRNDELIEPQGSALARLCAYCIFAAAQLEGPDHPGSGKSRKRQHRDDEVIHFLQNLFKISVKAVLNDGQENWNFSRFIQS